MGRCSACDQTTEVNFNGAFELIRFANKTAVDVNALGGADTVNVNYTLAAAGLATLTVNGGGDGDTMNVLQSTPAGVTTNLDGNADADSFVFSDGVLLPGNVDGNAGHDTLNLSAYTTARDVQLTGPGLTDGYNGTEAAMSGAFSNIDAILAPGGATSDRLRGPNRNTTWTVAERRQRHGQRWD